MYLKHTSKCLLHHRKCLLHHRMTSRSLLTAWLQRNCKIISCSFNLLKLCMQWIKCDNSAVHHRWSLCRPRQPICIQHALRSSSTSGSLWSVSNAPSALDGHDAISLRIRCRLQPRLLLELLLLIWLLRWLLQARPLVPPARASAAPVQLWRVPSPNRYMALS
jgi:hypothetical protein